ncbi:MAG: riboflavin synthase [Thermodesulfobacteriaceae bacterium]|nr:riboflavin synthase [Thermodesulfobacteriaceae bacterium]
MFTGLIEGIGVIKGFQTLKKGYSIHIESDLFPKDSKIGDSIAVDGACLTIVSLTSKGFTAHLSPETLSRTTLKYKKIGDLVNLEKALKMGDPLGGHLVTGHIDGIAKVYKITPYGDFYCFEIDLPKDFSHLLVPKGSIAIDGISLTINEVKESLISLMIIPHTFFNTTLHTKKEGDLVNFEIDIIAKMVFRWIKPYLKKVEDENTSTLELLRKTGFL